MAVREDRVAVERFVRLLANEIHSREGGQLKEFVLDDPIFGGKSNVDSIDFAEIVLRVEDRYGFAAVTERQVPRTWAELIGLIVEA